MHHREVSFLEDPQYQAVRSHIQERYRVLDFSTELIVYSYFPSQSDDMFLLLLRGLIVLSVEVDGLNPNRYFIEEEEIPAFRSSLTAREKREFDEAIEFARSLAKLN